MPRITVDVTQEHISKGCRSDGNTCPVARAVLDILKDNLWVYVDASVIEIYEGPRSKGYNIPYIYKIHALPDKVGTFIEWFDEDIEEYELDDPAYSKLVSDRKAHVEPFSFSVAIPKRYLR